MAIQGDGKIVVVGAFAKGIARLNTDGSLDTTFNVGTGVSTGGGWVHSVAIQGDGKILFGGRFNGYNGAAVSDIARINPDGSLDTAFDPGTGTFAPMSGLYGYVDSCEAIAFQADGKIMAGGSFSIYYNGTIRHGISRILP